MSDHHRSLVTRIAQEDLDAWGELWLEMHPIVTTYLEREWPALDAEELASETLERVRGRAHTFRGDSSVKTWIIGISRRVAQEANRTTETRISRDDMEKANPGLLARAEASLVEIRSPTEADPGAPLLAELVDALPPAQREAVRNESSYSSKEEARRGMTPQQLTNYKQNLSRGLKRIRSRIDTEDRYETLRPKFGSAQNGDGEDGEGG